MRDVRVIKIVLTAVFIALVTATTYIGIPWPLAAGGYMHLGTLTALIIALAFGKKYGALAGGIGMFLFDVFSPWVVWAPGTLIVRLLMGFVVGYIANDLFKVKDGDQVTNWFMQIVVYLIAIVAGAVVMITGYYFYEAIFLTDFNAAILSINGNLVQFTLGLLSIPVVIALKVAGVDKMVKLEEDRF